MKTDSSIDYYAILGVDSKASDEEIKKAFRKQALLHHPDRNPGKEEEAKSRFQDVHTAYDLLSDKGKREKYDRDRQKKSPLWERSAAPPRPAPYTASSAFQQTQSSRPPRSSASRYAAFADPPRTPFPGTNANAKFEDFKAFESMRGGHRPTSNQRSEPPPRQHRPPPTAQRPPASKARSRGEWDEDLAGRGSPGMFRSQSTRSPRKNGFNPYAVGGDEPGTRNVSTNYNTRTERAQTTESKFYASSPTSGRSPRPQSMAFDSQRFDVEESPGGSYSPNRTSMPYAAKSGEKTYFSTAGLGRFSQSFTNMDGAASEEATKASGSGRFRSASPQARTPQPPQEETSSSGSEDETYTDSKKTSQQSEHGRRASAAPRFHGANVTVEDEAEHDLKQFSKPSRNQTWTQQSPVDGESRTRRQYQYPPPPPPNPQFFPKPPSPRQSREHRGSVASDANGDGPPRDSAVAAEGPGSQAKRPSLYDSLRFSFANFDLMKPDGSRSVYATAESRTKSTGWPYWAIPSSLTPLKKAISRAPSQGNHHGYCEILNGRQDHVQDTNADSGGPLCRFSIPSSSSSSVTPSKNESSENVNVQFVPPNWHGRFDSPVQAGSTIPSPGSSSSKVRGSPPKRPGLRPTYRSPSFTRSGPTEEDMASQQMPPPPPPSQSQSRSQANGSAETQMPTSTSPSKFASEEWHAQFQNQNNWAKPGPHPPPRQMQTPKSRNFRGAQTKRATANGQAKDSAAAEDPGNDGDDEARQSGSNIETEGEMSRSASGTAMEIDTDSPPGASRDPSNTRPDSLPKTAPGSQNATSPAPASAFPRPPEPQIGLNMQHLQNVYPLNGTSAAGLDGMKADLASSLPFESGTTQEAMPMPKAQTLELPLPPKAPVKPVRYSPPACEQYMKSFSTYVREFQHFNARMLTHFGARQSAMVDMTTKNTEAAEKGFCAMCNGAGQGLNKSIMADVAQWSWMGARSNEGYMRYMAWLEEDDRVEEHWRVAWELHRKAMKDLGEVRKVMIGLST